MLPPWVSVAIESRMNEFLCLGEQDGVALGVNKVPIYDLLVETL